MTIDYASEKLWEAVHNLAIGRGRIKERLRDVREVIGRVNTERVDLSPSFQAEYDALIELVAKATATSASHETGYRAAKEILRLAYKAREIVQTERGASQQVGQVVEKFPPPNEGKARDQAAELVGVNPHCHSAIPIRFKGCEKENWRRS